MDMSVICIKLLQQIQADSSGSSAQSRSATSNASSTDGVPVTIDTIVEDVERIVMLSLRTLNLACVWAVYGLWHLRYGRHDQAVKCLVRSQGLCLDIHKYGPSVSSNVSLKKVFLNPSCWRSSVADTVPHARCINDYQAQRRSHTLKPSNPDLPLHWCDLHKSLICLRKVVSDYLCSCRLYP